ncbi:MAG: bifunctional methylenetetrahydrofolate dehydrogenase/methenyltetrahydrofolate cyclohydrolase FolD [Planctomycetota bacterium]
MSATIIDGKQIAEMTRLEVATTAAEFQRRTGIVPHLTAVLVGDDPASQVYVRNKEKAAQKAGLRSTLIRLPQATTQPELLEVVQGLNNDSSVHGILVQLPLPRQIDAVAVLDAIHPLKDVDAFHPENVGLMLQGRPRYLPCTPAGVMKLLEASGTTLAGAHAVVIGRSDIVGKPMAALLMQKGADATVTVCHSRTRDLPSFCRQADILVAAIGIPEFVKGDMIKPGGVVIDVGINRLGDRLVGDVDYEPAARIASAITPVPGGVGPMTIAMLLQNTLKAAELASK